MRQFSCCSLFTLLLISSLSYSAIGVAEGDAPPASPDPNMSQQATPNASVSADAVSLPTSTQPAGNSAATTIAQVYDTYVDLIFSVTRLFLT